MRNQSFTLTYQPWLPLEFASWATLEWQRISLQSRIAEWKRHLAELHLDFDSFCNDVILDLGCGPTGIAYFLPAKQSFGLDPLAENYEKWNGYWGKRIQLVSGVGEKIPLKSASIDTVFCVNCVDHTRHPEAVLREIGRVLRPGGLLIFHVDLDSPLRRLHKLVRRRCGILHPHSLSYDWLLRIVTRKFNVMEIHRDPEAFKPIWRQMKYEAYWDGLIYRFTGSTRFVNHIWLKAVKFQPS